MKFVNVLASAAVMAIMASCSCCTCTNEGAANNENAACENAAKTETAAPADSAAQAEQAAQVKKHEARVADVAAGEELSEATDSVPEVKKIFGRIDKIDGDKVSVKLRGQDETVTVAVPNANEMIEGAPVRIAYTTDADGNNVASEARIPQRYRNLLGKWATEDNSISYELRRRNRARSLQKKNNIEYKGWFATRDSLEFEFVPAGQKNSFFDKWYVAELDSNHLLLVKDGGAKFDMHRVDSNED